MCRLDNLAGPVLQHPAGGSLEDTPGGDGLEPGIEPWQPLGLITAKIVEELIEGHGANPIDALESLVS